MKDLKGTKTEQNLAAAFAGESQAHTKYQYFASKAKKDGYVNLNIDGKETPVDIELIGKILATYKSLLKNDVYTIDTTGNKEALEEDTSKIMKRAIAFNNSIAVSKTRQSVFLEQWPNTTLDYRGVIAIDPCDLDKKMHCSFADCDECRLDFWTKEVE